MSVYAGSRKIGEIYFGGQKIKEAYYGNILVYKTGPDHQSIIDALNAENSVDKHALTSYYDLIFSYFATPQYYKSVKKVKDALTLNTAFLMNAGDTFSYEYQPSLTTIRHGVRITHTGSAVKIAPNGVAGAKYWGGEVTHPTSKPALIVVTFLGVSVNDRFYKAKDSIVMNIPVKNTGLVFSGKVSSSLYVRPVVNDTCGVYDNKASADSYYKHGIFKTAIDLAGVALA